MFKKRMIFWDQERQKIRFSASNDFDGISRYSFIGFANDPEFEVLLDVLFERYGDSFISTEKVITVYQEFMMFLDSLKKVTSSI